MRFFYAYICIIIGLHGISSCAQKSGIDYNDMESLSINGHPNAVIEIPAGTNLKMEYNKKTHRFLPDKRKGKDRKIAFLPYPGNYGFIPSTYSDPNKGGDGDALDILVISESVPTGTVMEAVPLAVLKLLDNGEQDYKIIAIPADIDKRVIDVTTFNELKTELPSAMKIIEDWFLNYDQEETASIEGWGDEKNA
ncbi:MAG: inorganic diphosphatase [Bacteroidota bacterium]